MKDHFVQEKLITIASWCAVIWMVKVFLSSLPYKFVRHPDTVHIFDTIGTWMKGILGNNAGQLFTEYGSYGVGLMELIASVILLIPALLFFLEKVNLVTSAPGRYIFHAIGGVLAGAIMTGAVFFHLATPLGIEVLHNGVSDHGSLFYAAVSIMVLGYAVGWTSFTRWRANNPD